MNHKLQLTVRADIDADRFGLHVEGCLTAAAYPVLLRAVVRAGRMAAGPLTLDLRDTVHLDPDVLLRLRALAGTAAATPEGTAGPGQDLPRITLIEPAELPVCLAHVAIDGAVLDRLDSVPVSHSPGCVISQGAGEEEGPIDGFQLCQYYEGTLDPALTVRALSDDGLVRLTDALYRHLDSPGPSFGARTWFELATDELDRRGRRTAPAALPGAFADRNGGATDEGLLPSSAG